MTASPEGTREFSVMVCVYEVITIVILIHVYTSFL